MFICATYLGHGAEEKLRALSPEAYAELRLRAPGFDLPEDQAGRFDTYLEKVVTSDEVAAMSEIGLELSIKRVRGLHYSAPPGVPAAKAGDTVIYNVSVPNVGLLAVQAVEWMEDCCTEELQRVLDAGWRILAVCPPNDARRPTYIVGHADRNAKL